MKEDDDKVFEAIAMHVPDEDTPTTRRGAVLLVALLVLLSGVIGFALYLVGGSHGV